MKRRISFVHSMDRAVIVKVVMKDGWRGLEARPRRSGMNKERKNGDAIIAAFAEEKMEMKKLKDKENERTDNGRSRFARIQS